MKWILTKFRVAVCLFLTVVLFGCHENRHQAARSNLTPGMAKKSIAEGVTTQADIVKVFGSPNMVMKKNGKGEVWTYDQISVIKEANGYMVGMGLGGGGPVDPAMLGGAVGFHVDGRTLSSAVRSITLVIEFDEKEVVKKYDLLAMAY